MKKIFTILVLVVSVVFVKAQSWTTPNNYINATLAGASFVSASQGWVVGSGGAIYTTNNGGSTWTSQISGTINGRTTPYVLNIRTIFVSIP